MTTVASIGGLDVSDRIIGNVSWQYGSANPGSPIRELQAGSAVATLDNSDRFMTAGRGAFILRPNVALELSIDGVPVIDGMRLSEYRTDRLDGNPVAICQFTHTLYLLTSSKASISQVYGRASNILDSMLNRIEPDISVTVPDGWGTERLVIRAESAYRAILALLQSTRTTLIERIAYGQLELIDSSRGERYYLYDNDAFADGLDATRIV